MQNDFFERFRRHESLWVLLLFVLLTTIAAWNIVTKLDGVIIGDDNDTYINPWADWWTQRAISDPKTSLWHTEMMYYPVGADLTYHSFSHLNTAVSLALRPFIGVLPAYNITILLNFVLAGFSMFHLGRYMTGSSVAGILAGIVFAYNSHSLYQSAHPVLVSIWCFPWMTLFFIRAVREDRIAFALAAAVFVFLGAATSTVLVFLMAFWIVLLIIFMLFSKQFSRPQWRILIIFGSVSALLIIPTVYPLLISAISGGNTNFIIDPNQSIKTDIISPIVPHWYVWLKRGIYFGIMPFFLAMLAFGREKSKVKLWLLLTIVAFLFAIGPEPELAHSKLGFVLPWTYLVTPFLRNTYRMMILMSMGIAMLSAYGWLGFQKSLQDKTQNRKAIVALLVGAAIFIDYTAVPFPNTPATVSTFYTDYLDDVPQDVVLATVPTGRQEDKRYMYYQTVHEHPMTGGVISRAGTEVYAFIYGNPLLRFGAVDLEPVAFPSNPESAMRQLAEANVGFLIIDKQLTKNLEIWRDGLAPQTPVFEDGLLLVYATEGKE